MLGVVPSVDFRSRAAQYAGIYRFVFEPPRAPADSIASSVPLGRNIFIDSRASGSRCNVDRRPQSFHYWSLSTRNWRARRCEANSSWREER